jgi:hypothetical protein
VALSSQVQELILIPVKVFVLFLIRIRGGIEGTWYTSVADWNWFVADIAQQQALWVYECWWYPKVTPGPACFQYLQCRCRILSGMLTMSVISMVICVKYGKQLLCYCFSQLSIITLLNKHFYCICMECISVWTSVSWTLIFQNYWGFGLCPLSSILETRKYEVSENGSVSILRWRGGRHLLCWVT